MRALDFAAAWTVADRVLAARDPAARDDPALPLHPRWVWDGTPPDRRRVLVPLLAGLPGIDRLVAFDTATPLPPSVCDIEIMELGHVLRVDGAPPPSRRSGRRSRDRG